MQVAGVADEDLRDPLGRQRGIGHAGGDRAARHPGMGRRLRGLGEDQPAVLFDRPDPGTAVAAGAREDHADGALFLVFGKRDQEGVDRAAGSAALARLGQVQDAVCDRHLAVRTGSCRRSRVEPWRLPRPPRRSCGCGGCSSSTMWLCRVGSRCWMTTKAMPLSAGTAPNSFSSASRPPADAPTPTMTKALSPAGGSLYVCRLRPLIVRRHLLPPHARPPPRARPWRAPRPRGSGPAIRGSG